MAKKSPSKSAQSAKKKPVAAAKVAKPVAKAKVKPTAKPVAKPAAKLVTKVKVKPAAVKPVPKAAAATGVSKTSLKKSVVEKKGDKALSSVISGVKSDVKPKSNMSEKPAIMTKKGHDEDRNQGEMLIEIARQEMSAHNGNDSSKAEKTSKFKPIKVERGNLADEKAKWQELYKRYGKEKASNYKMTDVFESLKPIQHKVLGWGFVLTNENSRLEVLFENGIKMLISNYKPS